MAGMGTSDDIDRAAIDWVMALHDRPRDTDLRQALANWLAASPAHRAAYKEARRVWLLTGWVPASAIASARASEEPVDQAALAPPVPQAHPATGKD